MLQRPDVPDEKVISCLQDSYGLSVAYIDFLPLGADVNTAVYRAVAGDGAHHFVKLRRGALDKTTVAVPAFLSKLGIAPVIAPIGTRSELLWARVDGYTAVLYPYLPGQDGYETRLSDGQWAELGAALKGIHTAALPGALARRIPRERFPSQWRDSVRMHQAHVAARTAAGEPYDDPVAAQAAGLLQDQVEVISRIVERAGRLADALRARPLEYVLCHGDMHPGNVLVTDHGRLYVVDWDTLIYAPKERDLMFFGGGGQGKWRSAAEEALFYRSYGRAEIDATALAYYRYERVIEDIAAFCDQLLLTNEGGEDREQGLRFLASNFLPGHDIEIARRSDTGV